MSQKSPPFLIALLTSLTLASAQAGLTEGYQAYLRGDYELAHGELEPLARGGDGIAAYYLGLMFWDGNGVDRDIRQGLAWLRQAARSGHTDAQFRLGLAYHNGDVVQQDYQAAAEWMLRAAEGGNSDAQYHVGVYFADGRGIVENDAAAFEWIQRSVERGATHANFLDALLYLGGAREWGRGMPQSLVEAYKWYALASGYSINQRRIHDEAGRAMGALTTRMNLGQLTDARRLARQWEEARRAYRSE